MKKFKYIFLLCLFMSACRLVAQDISQAQRYIKVGNTLREAKQFSLAEEYLLKGKTAVEKLKNNYWTAVALENLGLLYRDKRDNNQAVMYFRQASKIYQSVGSNTSAKFVTQVVSGIRGEISDLYGGIEIGSKGVKLSLVSVQFTPTGKMKFAIEKSDDIITDAIKGTDESFKATSLAVKVYLDTLLNRRKLAKDHIFIVASSGLGNGLRKIQQEAGSSDENLKMNKLKEMIHTTLGTNWGQPVEFINAKTESELTVKGTLEETEWNTTATLDIGSGNTKGGFFVYQNFKYVDFIGTATFTSMVEKEQKSKSFADACKFVMEDNVQSNQISSQIGQHPEFYTRDKIYLLGGIVYAITTYLHPEQIFDTEVPLTYNEVKQFRERAIADYRAVTSPSLTHIDNDKIIAKANKEIAKLREKTFTQNQIIAGSTLLLGIMEELRKQDTAKKFIFNREGYIGWISGYIVTAIENEYKQKKEM